MLRCPVCRAETAGPVCRRCRADLGLMEAVEARREFHISSATAAMAGEQFDTALVKLDAAEQLREGADIRRQRACAYLLAGDFEAALAEHSLATRS